MSNFVAIKTSELNMDSNAEKKRLALIGNITGHLDLDPYLINDNPSSILVYSNKGRLCDIVRDWSYKNNYIPIEQTHSIDDILNKADVIYIFYEYISSSFQYKPLDFVLDEDYETIKNNAKTKGIKTYIQLVEKTYFFNFLIYEKDKYAGNKYFTIFITSKDNSEKYAKGKAIAEAQLKYIHYINQFNKFTAWDFRLCIEQYNEKEYRYYWHNIDTDEITRWYESTIEKYEFDRDQTLPF